MNESIEKSGTGIDPDFWGEVVHSYTRKDAIEDGNLVDLSESEIGKLFKFPIACTRTVWDTYIEPAKMPKGEDVSGRLWDMGWMLSVAARISGGQPVMMFKVIFHLTTDGDWQAHEKRSPDLGRSHREVELKAIIGPGDTMDPVITILMPLED